MISLLLLAAVAGAHPEPPRLALIGFTHVGVGEDLVSSYAETFAMRLGESGALRVTTPQDVAGMIGIDRQRQLMGCAESATTCLAELAGALGVVGVIRGEVLKVGSTLQLTIRILSPNDGKPLFLHIKRLPTEEAVLAEIDVAAKLALARLTELLGLAPSSDSPRAVPVVAQPAQAPREVSMVTQPAAPQRPLLRLVPGAIGVVAAGVGAAAAVMAQSRYQTIVQAANTGRNTSVDYEAASKLKTEGEGLQTAAVVLCAVGGAAIAASTAWYLWGGSPEQPVQAAPLVAPGFAGLALSGRLP